jgi:hypothetical protein
MGGPNAGFGGPGLEASREVKDGRSRAHFECPAIATLDDQAGSWCFAHTLHELPTTMCRSLFTTTRRRQSSANRRFSGPRRVGAAGRNSRVPGRIRFGVRAGLTAGDGGPVRSAGYRWEATGIGSELTTAPGFSESVGSIRWSRPALAPQCSTPALPEPNSCALRSDDTEARNDVLGCFGRSHRHGQPAPVS